VGEGRAGRADERHAAPLPACARLGWAALTPVGWYKIQRRIVGERKADLGTLYDPQYFYKGWAIHGSNSVPAYPASHGCIRLPMEFAKKLFDLTEKGGTVVIAGGHEDPIKRPAAGVLAPAMAGVTQAPVAVLTSTGAYTWTPEASPTGPVSIIISTGDQQVVVLRNGVEIGRAHANVQHETTEAQVMTYAGGKDRQWIQVGVSDLTGEPAEIISTQRVEQMQLPAAFVTAMRSVITPGTTVLVTQASVSAASTGLQTTVMDANDAAN